MGRDHELDVATVVNKYEVTIPQVTPVCLNAGTPRTQGILERAAKLVPGLDVSEELILEERCGLRPSRPQLRLELEAAHACGRPVVHSYGHGGSGWTVFVGAAREAADLVEGALRPE